MLHRKGGGSGGALRGCQPEGSLIGRALRTLSMEPCSSSKRL